VEVGGGRRRRQSVRIGEKKRERSEKTIHKYWKEEEMDGKERSDEDRESQRDA
jgi:hypothetical protein